MLFTRNLDHPINSFNRPDSTLNQELFKQKPQCYTTLYGFARWHDQRVSYTSHDLWWVSTHQ